ncbi:hypothetical protein MMC10_000004 [Thelotrema lepadinum]|nr:hypothetical protein [Thelotrema lepadinum]
MPPKEDKGAEPSPMKGSGSRSRIDPLTLAMEVANAREKGGKVDWEVLAKKMGSASGHAIQVCWYSQKKKHAEQNVDSDNPLAPKSPRKVRKTPAKGSASKKIKAGAASAKKKEAIGGMIKTEKGDGQVEDEEEDSGDDSSAVAEASSSPIKAKDESKEMSYDFE